MNERDVALEAARAAAALQHVRPHEVRHKGTVDLVTEVDLASEAAIRAVLARHTPDVPVLGEEGGGAEGKRTRWVVDPLDGTTNFVHGLPHYGPSVALEVDGQVQVGVVLDVSRGEAFHASRGEGAFCGERPLRVSTVPELGHALLATGFPAARRDEVGDALERVRRVLGVCQGIRRAGAAALDLAWVAAGRLDAYWEFGLGPWDVAAGALLVEEAGGRVDWLDAEGRRQDLPGPRPSPLASNGRLHAAVEALIARP